MTGMWLINVVSGKRHLISTWRASLNCRCGCKGWHSNWVILRYVRFCLEALVEGRRPIVDMYGKAWEHGHVMRTMLRKFGRDLG
eukprot:1057192-Pyramimonas_sp.AAC.1